MELRKSYPALKEAIASVRHDVAALAEFLGANEPAVENVRLAVSEAATHLVRRLYEHTAGRIHVTVALHDQHVMSVRVSDDGHRTAPRSRESGLGMGFAVMRECADALTMRHTEGGGLEIEMRFAVRVPAAKGVRSRVAQLKAPAAGSAERLATEQEPRTARAEAHGAGVQPHDGERPGPGAALLPGGRRLSSPSTPTP